MQRPEDELVADQRLDEQCSDMGLVGSAAHSTELVDGLDLALFCRWEAVDAPRDRSADGVHGHDQYCTDGRLDDMAGPGKQADRG